jgi:MEDS: MEthanogen/methylotroph, DcmR Sensory domain/Histidine kinase-like ATPase domain
VPVLPAAHLVHFYSTPEGLAQSLSGFFAEPLKRGESVIIVARPEHRRAVDQALRDAGVDLAAELRAGRYVSLDVNETLAGFLADDRVSRQLFDSHAPGMILGAKRRTGNVHVYGELIAALLERGDVVGAMEFESMWGELLRESPFPLICGYPREALEGDLATVIDGVASVHDAFLVAGSAARSGPAAGLDLPLGPGATNAGRRHVRDVLTARGQADAESLDDAALVVTELLGTAARQGSDRVRLSLTVDDSAVVLTVLDAAGPADRPRSDRNPDDDMTDGGRSFAVLGALAEGWGVEQTTGGRTVWARLRRPSVP